MSMLRMSVSRPPVLYVSGALNLMKVGGEVAGEWMSLWDGRLVKAAWLESEGSERRKVV